VKANASVVPAGSGGAINVYATDTTDLVLDITGYFEPATATTLQFYPLTPCRVVDTRNDDGPLGGPHLIGGQERDFPVQSSHCGIPSNAQAYSMNLTVVPWLGKPLGFLTVWDADAGTGRPVVSTLNNTTGTVVANAAIVPAGSGGAIAVYSDQDTQLVADIDGYFAPPGPSGYSFYSVLPCRVLDTRNSGGMFNGKRVPSINVSGSPCGIPDSARGYVFNATVVPVGTMGYLTLWPDGQNQPLASTLNAADGVVTSNMAVVPTQNGHIDAFANGSTQLVLDLSGYFAP
jgi:hypothetical protein